METKHTPGPWTASGNGTISGGKYNTTQIADTGWCFWTNRLHELMQETTCPDDVQNFLRKNIVTSKSNAKLIAAAPELLEACQISREYITILENFISNHLHLSLPVLDYYQDPLDKLESAILKAGAE